MKGTLAFLFDVLCLLSPLWLTPFLAAQLAGAGNGGVQLRLLLLLLLRGSLPRMTTQGKFLDHLLIERGYIGRLSTTY